MCFGMMMALDEESEDSQRFFKWIQSLASVAMYSIIVDTLKTPWDLVCHYIAIPQLQHVRQNNVCCCLCCYLSELLVKTSYNQR